MDLWSCLQPEMGQGPDTECRLVAYRYARHRGSPGAQTLILENPPGPASGPPQNGPNIFRGPSQVVNGVLVPGAVSLVIDPSQNLSGAIFEGLDYEAIYILDSTIFGNGDWGRITTTINGTWLSRAEFQATPDTKRVGIAGEFLPPAFALTSSLPWNRANASVFYDGPADSWMQGLDVGAVVHWTGQYEDDNASLTGATKLQEPRSGPLSDALGKYPRMPRSTSS